PDIPSDAVPVPVSPIPELTRTQSSFEDASTHVIRSDGEWTRLLAAIGGPDGPPAGVAPVDLTDETVLAVAIGYRPSGG
ncbi:hypothetical protein DQE84_19710, partial [Staphylococcus warneri]